MLSLDFKSFLSELQDVLKNPRPWSHVRCGDGEGLVLGWPGFVSEKRALDRWNKWLGTREIPIKCLKEKIQTAILNADIVGIPCLRHQRMNSDWRNVKKILVHDNLISETKKTCCMDCTVELQTGGHFAALFEGIKKLNYISCRDVTEVLKKVFKIESINSYFIPVQHRPALGRSLTIKKHFPDCFAEIEYWIKARPEEIFLVGAGGLGKIYCNWIKEAQGIAIDIGSLFDGWAGLITRSYLKDIKKFKL